MKQKRKRPAIRLTLALCLAALALATAACTDQIDDRTPAQGEVINVSNLHITIGSTQVATTDATRAATRTATTPTEDPTTGYTGCVKTSFVPGDVVHILAQSTTDDGTSLTNDSKLYSRATLTNDGHTWSIVPLLTLEKGKKYHIRAFCNATPIAVASGSGEPSLNPGTPETYANFDAADQAEIRSRYLSVAGSSSGTGETNAISPYTDCLRASNTTLAPANGTPNFNSNTSTLTLAADGKLTICLAHVRPLITVSRAICQLGSGNITAISANIAYVEADYDFNSGGGKITDATVYAATAAPAVPIALYPGTGSGSSSTAQSAGQAIGCWPYINGTSAIIPFLQSFTVTVGGTVDSATGTVSGGTDYTVLVPNGPDASGSIVTDENTGLPIPGRPLYGNIDGDFNTTLSDGTNIAALYRNKEYAYHLSLLPGALTAIPDDGTDNPWDDQGPLLSIPTGYIPIYTEEDLRKIGVEAPGTDAPYTYTPLGPDGTPGTPLPYSLDASYILMADIDLTPTRWKGRETVAKLTDLDQIAQVPANELWTPIGVSYSTAFTGRFNGNGHTVSGMTIYHTDASAYLGFFGCIGTDAVVYNLHLSGARIKSTGTGSGYNYIGTLAGYTSTSAIALCSATGCAIEATGTTVVGGLVGQSSASLIRCHATGCEVKVPDSSMETGALVSVNYSSLVACYTSGCTVTAKSSSGLIGRNRGTAYGCYAYGATVTGTGSDISALIENCFGGSSIAASCYATTATGSTAAGLAGDLTGMTIAACVSPFQSSAGTGTSPGHDTDKNGIDNNGGTYWGTGYQALLPSDADKAALASAGGPTVTNADLRNTFDTDGNRTNVLTAVLNADGSIKAESRTWTAQGIWGSIATGSTTTPHIRWTYEGER